MPMRRRKPTGRASKARRSTTAKLNKVAKDVSKLKSQVEVKSIDHVEPWTSVSTTEEVYILNGNIPQGGGDSERIGNKISAKSMQIKYQCKIGDGIAANDSYNQMRVIVLKYVTDNPTAPIPLDQVLQTVNPTNPEETMLSPYKRDSKFLFTKMSDKVHNLYWGNNSGGTGGAPRIKSANLKFKLKDAPIRYSSLGDLKTFYAIIFVSDSNVADHPEFCFHSRFYYTDA